ncbi:hypothetical protein PAXRUDRAFT_12231 [Paxillus rubicundulus Ve08.2h10]|uniref:FAD-binding FR-type domain-containing protein n=1 Tax=Paxillus rubicundulus Ve08.2h10 TaxID=930991 RepID=A0A0D0DPW2_9AGAM|nr:hypothetical protein PAXRUDRAFT_12231 [Paxillus rubicundulus Ve08.2h10]
MSTVPSQTNSTSPAVEGRSLGYDLTLEFQVIQALGLVSPNPQAGILLGRRSSRLCPKYINARALEPRPNVASRLIYEFIHHADTAFLATTYVANPKDADIHPSREGTNHRGGRPGFVRVCPGDGRTTNYAGNRMMNSLGNIYIAPSAGLGFPSFSTGSVLYVTGTEETRTMPLREVPDTTERSPYSPPVCYLSEEEPPTVAYDDVTLAIVSTRVHDDALTTFMFGTETSRPIESTYSSIALYLVPHRQSDPRRTYQPNPPSNQIAQDADPKCERKDVDVSALGIVTNLRGVGGDLPVLEPNAACDGGRRLLWIAGGIGLTPFLNFTKYVVLVISTREPGVVLALPHDAFRAPHDPQTDDRPPVDLMFAIHLLSTNSLTSLPSLPTFASLSLHHGRIDDGNFSWERGCKLPGTADLRTIAVRARCDDIA